MEAAQKFCKLLDKGSRGIGTHSTISLETAGLSPKLREYLCPGGDATSCDITPEGFISFLKYGKASYSNPENSPWLYPGGIVSPDQTQGKFTNWTGPYRLVADSGLGIPIPKGPTQTTVGTPILPWSSSWVTWADKLMPIIFGGPSDITFALAVDDLASRTKGAYPIDGNTNGRYFGALPLSFLGTNNITDPFAKDNFYPVGPTNPTPLAIEGGQISTQFNCWAANDKDVVNSPNWDEIEILDNYKDDFDYCGLPDNLGSNLNGTCVKKGKLSLGEETVPHTFCVTEPNNTAGVTRWTTCGGFIGEHGEKFPEYAVKDLRDLSVKRPMVRLNAQFQCQMNFDGTSGIYGTSRDDFYTATNAFWREAFEQYQNNRTFGIAKEATVKNETDGTFSASETFDSELIVDIDANNKEDQKLMDTVKAILVPYREIKSEFVHDPENPDPWTPSSTEPQLRAQYNLAKELSHKLHRHVPALCVTTIPAMPPVDHNNENELLYNWEAIGNILHEGLNCDTEPLPHTHLGPLVQLLECPPEGHGHCHCTPIRH